MHSPSRRSVLKTAGFAGLVIALPMPLPHVVQAAEAEASSVTAYLRIGADDSISVVCPNAELGQGIFTTLPKVLCEELEVDFDKVAVTLAYGDEKAFGRQVVGGSTSTISFYANMRKAGAAAREMLVAAAAARWKVPAERCRATAGRVTHEASGRALTYGQVALAASKLPVPKEPKLKVPADFTLIGKSALRKDTPQKVDGSAQYGADIVLPGLVTAALAMAPRIGATVKSFDETSLKSLSGIVKVLPLAGPDKTITAVAVVADTYWQAKRGVDALQVEWTGGDATLTSAKIAAAMRASLDDDSKARVGKEGNEGDVPAALKASVKSIDVTYEAPYLAHACMEPMAMTALIKDDSAMIWAPTQQPGALRKLAAEMSGLPLEKVTAQTTFLGGGFGRKWEMDYQTQTLQIAVALKGWPVRLVWTREQDIQNDFYRPAAIARIRAGIDDKGNVTVMHARSAVQSIIAPKKMAPPGTFDATATEGLVGAKYAFPNVRSEWVEAPALLPVGFWRSVGLSQNLFISESAIDEVAHLAGRDPYQLRRDLLKGKDRELKVLDAVAKMSGWGRKLPQGHGLGIAFGVGFRSTYAQVAEVSVLNNELRVHKVWATLDPGIVIDPAGAVAQIESGIVYGLSAALFGEITIEKGGIAQTNFNDYGMVTLRTMPDIECELIQGGDTPTGVGEAGVPAIAPAIANAIFAATGQRLRKLPLHLSGMMVAEGGSPTPLS